MSIRSLSVLTWDSQAYRYLIQNEIDKAVEFYEQAVESCPEVKSNYWYLGLLLLLHEQEAEAQTFWLMTMAEGTAPEIEQWTADLLDVLRTEAERREQLADYAPAWLIRQHMREIYPDQLDNLLRLTQLSLHLGKFNSEILQEFQLISALQFTSINDVDAELLSDVLNSVLKIASPDPIILEFTKTCLPFISNISALRRILLSAAFRFGHLLRQPQVSASLLEQYLALHPDDVEVLGNLAIFYQDSGQYDRGIRTAQQRYDLVESSAEKIFSSHLLLRGLLSAGGYWNEAVNAAQRHKKLLAVLQLTDLSQLALGHTTRLFNSAYYLPYFDDNPQFTRTLQNHVVRLASENIRQNTKLNFNSHLQKPSIASSDRRLKVGYLSHCLCSHSVGWLARWLIQNHNRDRVELYAYFINYRSQDWLQDWYASQVDHPYCVGIDGTESRSDIADRIYQDEIDILVDLDSITLDVTCEVLALKPAPIQVTWLGWDASGLPSVDYYIADPYVLPEAAQSYYTEKIWRLPQTYIAVEGFEVDVPTLRRDQLGIPSDAVIYLSTQKGYKRHRETAKLQMQIIQAVPNSYFLIKGFADQKSIQTFFFEIAEEVGVSRDRIRFLPDAISESVHRANLAIADVVLDTYPYNGATTTLETLWMGIPLVTRVGEQFAARNSYTMMVNAGITEGIAWSDDEYVEWGVRLGKNTALRQKIHWDLLRSRQTAPLWNAKQFARDMEDAYHQMWEIHQRS